MSEWFDLCRGLRRIARHNSRCENGWLISFYSWHRGLSVWLCAHSAQLGAHTGYWQWPASARPGDTELILARGQAAHTRATRHPREGGPGQCTGVTWPGLRPALQLLWPIGAGPCTRRPGGNWSVYRLPNCRPPGCCARLARPDPGLSQSPLAKTRSAPIFKNIRRQ